MIILIFFIYLSSLQGQTNPFDISETLHYKASFANLQAAHASLKVIKKDTIHNAIAYHVQFIARTVGFANYLFPINDKIDLWLDQNSLLPLKIKSSIEEGNYKHNRDIELYQNYGYAITEKDTITIEYPTHSPYSLFYFFRKQDFNKIQEKTIHTIQGAKKIDLKLKIEENILAAVPAGSFICSKVTPSIINDKPFKNRATISILFSNDVNRYPVKIWFNLKYGSLVLELDQIINETI